MNVKLLPIILSLSVFILVFELIRREKLTFKYGAGWLVISISAIFFAIFDKILFKISEIFGFELPSNFIFFSLLSVFVFLGLILTIFLCQQNMRNDLTAQKIGLLEHELNDLKNKIEK